MTTGRRGGRWARLALPVVLAAACTHGETRPPIGLQSNTRPASTSAAATAQPGAQANLYIAHDDDLEGLDVSRLRPGQLALPDALATHTTLPPSTYDITRLAGRILAMSDKGSVSLIDPATGKVERSVKIAPTMLGEPVFTSLILDETEAAPDRKTAYVAGRFGRPNQRAFVGFVLGFDAQLKVTLVRKFNDDVIQNLAVDARGAIVVLTDGTVADAMTGATLRRPTYERASDAVAVRRMADGLWIVVGGGQGNAFMLTPKGRVPLPSVKALPIGLVVIPGGVAVISQAVDALYLVTGTQVRTVQVPQSIAEAVLLGSTLYVLSAGSDRLTRVELPSLATTEYVMPQVSTLIV